MNDMIGGVIGFLIGVSAGIIGMAMISKGSYDEGYRDAWMAAHNYGVKKKKDSDD